jgi:hypothetical protein
MFRLVLIYITLFLSSTIHGFVPPTSIQWKLQPSLNFQFSSDSIAEEGSQVGGQERQQNSPFQLLAQKRTKQKKVVVEESSSKEVDWGKIAGLFLFPGNPYAWFVYFFTFIIVYGTFFS